MYRIFLFIGFISFFSCEKDTYHDGLYHNFEGKFVYTDYDQSKYLIFTQDAELSKQITNTTRDRFSPQWLPDGKHIMYLSDDLGGLYIHVMDENGHNDKSLISTGTSIIGSLFYPTIQLSPDGNLVIIDRADSIIIYAVNGDFILSRIASYGCPTGYKHLIWAPDSKKFSCGCPGQDSFRHLHIYNVDSGQFFNATKDLKKYVIDQSWSHNSSQIAFISGLDIYLINADGTGLQRIIYSTSYASGKLAFSPYDDRIVYERADSLFDLVMYDLQTQTTDILINDKAFISGPLIWIEDGKYIFYGYGEETFKLEEFRLFEIENKKSYTIIDKMVKGINYIEK